MFIAKTARLVGGIVALVVSSGYAAGVPDDCTQLIVGLAPDWNSMRGEMQLLERPTGGNWSPVSQRWPVIYGKQGLDWGGGIAGQNEMSVGITKRAGCVPPVFILFCI